MTCLKAIMFKNSLKSTCMYGLNVLLSTTCMHDMSVNNAGHRIYVYAQPNHIESECK